VTLGFIVVLLGGGGGYKAYTAYRDGTLTAGLLTAIAVGLLVLLLAVLVVVVLRSRGRARGDNRARHLAPPGELSGIRPTDTRRSAARLLPRVDLRRGDARGLPLGRTVRGKVMLPRLGVRRPARRRPPHRQVRLLLRAGHRRGPRTGGGHLQQG